jgi:hypothetical protein
MKYKMEYNLQKALESNYVFSHFLSTRQPYPHLSTQPARDYVTPGVGKLTSLYPLYVPVYGSSPPYEIKKSVDVEQIGTGNGNVSDVSSSVPLQEPIQEKITKPIKVKVPLQEPIQEKITNPIKRKLDDGIVESFLHPKIIKTKTIRLEPKKVTGSGTQTPINHKFQFF